MDEVIDKFLENKKIDNPLIRDTVRRFIVGHNELYGNFIPFEDLMMRLNENLDRIVIKDPEVGCTVGQFVGFKENTINMYFYKSSFDNEQLIEDFKGVLIHELTHCAYNIKNHDLYGSETQVFATFEPGYDGNPRLTNGTYNFTEPIINYISTSIDGRKTGAYIAQTTSIQQLADKIGQEAIVKNAFYANQEEFKTAMEAISPGAYDYFESGLSFFNANLYDHGKRIMDNFFMNNIPEKDPVFQSIKEGISSNRFGYVHFFGLMVFLIIVIFALIFVGCLLTEII